MPKLIANTRPSGASITIHIRGPPPIMMLRSVSDWAPNRATMPVKSTPETM